LETNKNEEEFHICYGVHTTPIFFSPKYSKTPVYVERTIVLLSYITHMCKK